MTIASEITRINNNIASAYTAVNNKGGTLPATQNSANLATAIGSIPTSSSPVINSLSITPTTSAQTITATGGVDGYSPITVNAVTSAIDANITAGNIKKDVTILGVTGTYEGSGGGGYAPLFETNYVINTDGSVTNLIFSYDNGGALNYDAALKPFATSFDNIPAQGIINLLNSNDYTDYSYTLNTANATTIDCYKNVAYLNLPNITSMVNFTNLFLDHTSLLKVNLHNAKSIRLQSGFSGCVNLTEVDLSSVDDLAYNNALGGASVRIGGAFAKTSITTLSFPSLKTTSFGSYLNQFRYMLNGVTGCTIHFPSNLQNTISGLTGYPNFGGTNTVLSFDLPATS